jgi:DNA-binding transcriptional LysR family regulator
MVTPSRVTPQDMVLFAAVVRAGSFTAAARALGLTKQSVSERIARLEAALQTRLLERTTRKLRVTSAGAPYAERCGAIAAQIDEANGEVQRWQVEPVGMLRVTAPVLYGRRALAPLIATYARAWPRVRVELLLTDRRVDLIDEGIDLAIRVGELDDSSLTARRLGHATAWVVASPGFLKRHGAPTAQTLTALPCIGMRSVERWSVNGAMVRIEPQLVVNDLEVLCEAAIAGVGVATLPALVCEPALKVGKLRVLFPGTPRLRPLWVVYPSRAYLPPQVRLFLDALMALPPFEVVGALAGPRARAR